MWTNYDSRGSWDSINAVWEIELLINVRGRAVFNVHQSNIKCG